MAEQLVRKFIVRSRPDWERFVAFIKANIAAVIDRGEALQIVVSLYRKQRSLESNSYMWVGLLEPMAEQAWVNGQRFKAEVWHEFAKEQYLPETCAKGIDKWLYLPNGQRRLSMSTGDLNAEEMGLYLHHIAEYATTELGVLLPANPRDL